MIIILVFIFLFSVFIPIGFKITYLDNRLNVDMFCYFFIKYKLDVDELIKRITSDKNKGNKFSLNVFLKNIEMFINSKKIIKDLLKQTVVTKNTIIQKENYDNIFTFIVFWNIIARFSFLTKKYFKQVKNEYYMIGDIENDVNVEMIIKINLFKVFIVMFKNIKEVLKLIKIRRRQKNDGTSYL